MLDENSYMFSWFKKKDDAAETEYMDMKDYNRDNKYKVKFFKIIDGNELEEIKKSVVEGKTICMINIGYCKEMEALKKYVTNLKEVCATFDADIVAFQQNTVIISPKGVDILRESQNSANSDANASLQ